MNIYFSENLKKLRQSKNLTQERLAEFLGVAFQTISKWERGESYPDITFLPKIASFFNTSIDDLLGVNKAKDDQEITNFIYEYDNYY
ncbi:MAG: helix-turn-helix domain-containing protein, partial [Eubacterium sp.]|nr:helix-turn-helix domain-containing protein [Eubacterium sp.]